MKSRNASSVRNIAVYLSDTPGLSDPPTSPTPLTSPTPRPPNLSDAPTP